MGSNGNFLIGIWYQRKILNQGYRIRKESGFRNRCWKLWTSLMIFKRPFNQIQFIDWVNPRGRMIGYKIYRNSVEPYFRNQFTGFGTKFCFLSVHLGEERRRVREMGDWGEHPKTYRRGLTGREDDRRIYWREKGTMDESCLSRRILSNREKKWSESSNAGQLAKESFREKIERKNRWIELESINCH